MTSQEVNLGASKMPIDRLGYSRWASLNDRVERIALVVKSLFETNVTDGILRAPRAEFCHEIAYIAGKQLIRRRFGDAHVEAHVNGDKLLVVVHQAREHVNQSPQVIHVFSRTSRASENGRVRLEDSSRFQESEHADVTLPLDGLKHLLRNPARGHKNSTSGPAPHGDDPGAFEHIDSFSNHCPADLERRGKVTLARKPFTRFVQAAANCVYDHDDHLFRSLLDPQGTERLNLSVCFGFSLHRVRC